MDAQIKNRKASFGRTIRRERERRGVTLRKFADYIGVSPTYLSKIERDEMPPPAEDKIRAIASEFRMDPNDLLALAGRIPGDIEDLFRRNPLEMGAFLRSTKGLPVDYTAGLLRAAKAVADEYEADRVNQDAVPAERALQDRLRATVHSYDTARTRRRGR